jgi:hypothetical protein
MSAAVRLQAGYAQERREMPHDIAEALRAYDNAKPGRERSRALARIADLRAEHRQAHRARDAQAIINALARKWTAWLREGEQ